MSEQAKETATPPIFYIMAVVAPILIIGNIWGMVAAMLFIVFIFWLIALALALNLGACVGSWLGGGGFNNDGK